MNRKVLIANGRQAIIVVIVVVAIYVVGDWIFSSPSCYDRVQEEMIDEVLPYCAEVLKENLQEYTSATEDYSLLDDLVNCVIDSYPSGVSY